jgi:hypothetical protein
MVEKMIRPARKFCKVNVAAKRRNLGADTTALEAEIDRLVYALYGLTPEEIKIVEESSQR